MSAIVTGGGSNNDSASTTRRNKAGSGGSSLASIHRPGLAIVGMSVPDVIVAVGGWSADCSLAGWQVDAYTPDEEEPTVLQIVGATPRRLDVLLKSRSRPDGVIAMAVGAEVFRRYPHLWERLSGWFARQLPALAVWGQPLPLTMIGQSHSTERPISTAAAAFKTLALKALESDAVATSTESVCSGVIHGVGARRPRARLG